MLCGLADLGELELVDAVGVQFVDGKGEGALEGGRRGEAGTERYVAGEDRVEAGDFAAALGRLAANSEYVAGPGLLRFVLFLQAELIPLSMAPGKT